MPKIIGSNKVQDKKKKSNTIQIDTFNELEDTYQRRYALFHIYPKFGFKFKKKTIFLATRFYLCDLTWKR